MPEISAEQLEAFQKGMTFLNEMATSPKTRRQFEGLAKTLRPEIETTSDIADAVAAPYVEKIETATKQIADFIAAQAKRDEEAVTAAADRDRDAAFARLKAEGYTEDGLDKITRIMVDRRIADPEAAAALFDRQNPKPAPEVGGSWEPAAWDIKGNAVANDIEGLFADPDRWADKQVYNVLQEVRSGKAA